MKLRSRQVGAVLGAFFGLATLVAASPGQPPEVAPVITAPGSFAVPRPVVDIAVATEDAVDPVASSAATTASTGEPASPSPAAVGGTIRPPGSGPAAIPVDHSETVVLAGGCFWGVQGVFEHVKGVTRAESGYIGGSRDTADYASVGSGSTGHAESVRITFDPTQVTFGQILQLFFSVVHDPTELNRQGPDTGSQYRSAVFAQDADQQRVAEAYIAQLNESQVYPDPIVTTVDVNTAFFPAEPYHQDYLTRNPTSLYIVFYDLPKLYDLQHLFPDLYRETPVLILAGG